LEQQSFRRRSTAGTDIISDLAMERTACISDFAHADVLGQTINWKKANLNGNKRSVRMKRFYL
jgi:hypothetical protein